MREVRCNLCGSGNYRVVCHNVDRQHHVDRIEFRLVQCSKCGLAYLNPQPQEQELQKYYPSDYVPYNQSEVFKYGPLTRMLRKLKMSSRTKVAEVEGSHSDSSRNHDNLSSRGENKVEISPLPATETVGVGRDDKSEEIQNDEKQIRYLDFGCGSGQHLEDIRRQHPNWQLFGLDNSPHALEAAKARGFEVFDSSSADTTLPPDFFDIINMSHAIEHVSDPRTTLLKVNKALRLSGRLIVSTPNFASLSRWVFGRFWFGLETPRHLFLFTPKTLTRLLEMTRFRVTNVRFKTSPAVEIKSFYYLLGRRDLLISPITWRLLNPITRLLSKCGLTSVMTVEAEKVST